MEKKLLIVCIIIAVHLHSSSSVLLVYSQDGNVVSTYNITRLLYEPFNNISGVLNAQVLLLNMTYYFSQEMVVPAVILEDIAPATMYLFSESLTSSPTFTVSATVWNTLNEISPNPTVIITEDGTYDPNYDSSQFPSIIAAMGITIIMVSLMLVYCIYILSKLTYQRGCKKQYIVSYFVLTNQIILSAVQLVMNILDNTQMISFRIYLYLTEYFILAHTSNIFLLYFFWLMVLNNKKLVLSTSHFKILHRTSIIVCVICQLIAFSLLAFTIAFRHPSSLWDLMIPYAVVLSVFVFLSTVGSVYVLYNIHCARKEFLFLKKPLARVERLFVFHCSLSILIATYSLTFAFYLMFINQIPVLVWLTKLNTLLNLAWSFSTISIVEPKFPEKKEEVSKEPKGPVYTLKLKESNPT